MVKQGSTITVIARVKTKNLYINEDPEAGSGNDESGFYMWSMCHSFTVQLYKLQIRSSTGLVFVGPLSVFVPIKLRRKSKVFRINQGYSW
jgi:hypothetical protein